MSDKERVLMAGTILDDIKQELAKYDLKVIGASRYTLGYSTVYHITAKGELWKSSLLIDKLGPSGTGNHRSMADAIHNDVYFLAPETTEIVVANHGDNIKKVSYLVFVFGGGG
ncbi:hypothetical protein MUP59_05725 [Candidatus Bathyarchaeota archaeon]|nr:hypothetical protein [Candidatus Bathyarchaeota archaeon]